MSTSRLRLIHARYRRTCGVVRFAASPAYKLRRFAGEWSFRVHASSVRLQPVTEKSHVVGGSTYSRGGEKHTALVVGESATDWSAA